MAEITDHVLVIDDDWSIRDVLSNILRAEGFDVLTAENGEEGNKLLDEQDFQIVITDMRMPKGDGIAVLRHIQDKGLDCLGIVATAYGSVESAVEALRCGAFDYVTKPFHLDEIRHVIHRAIEYRGLRRENVQLRQELQRVNKIENIVGASAPMQRLFAMITTVADSDSTVLVLGESGTGKELVARAIHYNSRRSQRPLIAVNCAAIPEDLLESELFGHVRGSFTGAISDRPGRFALADGGTIFLDEIGDMSPKLQVKVLRVLQEHEFEPVGATQTMKVNVRVIAATNQDLETRVRDHQFREDLFYRLNVIPIRLPPLRERRDDVPLLLQHFLEKFNKENHSRLARFSEEAIALLQACPWPGNVRELENLVERMSILVGEGEVAAADLPEKFRGQTRQEFADFAEFPPEGVDLNRLVERFEGRLIRQALDRSNGVKNQAAKLLNIKRTTLVEKIKKLGIAGEAA
ncbi:MAG: sigma-54 dependent transcriptional regulator [Candidatus Sumerlaeota bacterium]|nr:sigma-54 dependent transcriptional regulator [Candidatus Sumerlaeota bacterium]